MAGFEARGFPWIGKLLVVRCCFMTILKIPEMFSLMHDAVYYYE